MRLGQALKKNAAFLVSLVFAVAAAALIYASVQTTQPTVPVLVAARTLSVGETVSEKDVEVKRLPAQAVPPSALRSPRDAAGRTVTGGPVLAGDVLRAEHLSGEGSLAAALATFAPPGRVAVELPQDAGRGMLGIRRGDVVDVYAEVPAGPNGQGTVVDVVARGAVVLATPWSQVGRPAQGSQGGSESKSFVVAVRPEEAPALASLLVRGKKAAVVLARRAGQ